MALRDQQGRPLVAVTGMGVVTSLGQGKDDNWAALTAGRSGIRAHQPLPHRRPAHPHRGHGRLRRRRALLRADARPSASPTLAAEEAIGAVRPRRKGDFPGALFIAVPPVEMEWPQREALAAASGQDGDVTYADLLAAAATGRFEPWHDLFIFGTVADRIADRFGTKGSPISLSTACASGATAIQLGVEAIRRGETRAALCIGTDGSVNRRIADPLLAAVGALDPERPSGRRVEAVLARTATASSWREGAAALVLETLEAAQARGAKILGSSLGCGEKADGFHRTRSSPDGTPIIAAIRDALADAGLDAGRDRLHQRARHLDAGERQDGASGAARPCSASAWQSIPISSNKSMIGHTLTAAGAVEAVLSLLTHRATAAFRRPSTTQCPTRRSRSTWCRTSRAMRAVTHVLSNSFGFGGQNICLVIGGGAG